MEAPIPKTKMLEAAFRAAGHAETDIPTLVAHNKVTARTILETDGTVAIMVALPGGGYASPVIQEKRASRLAK